MRQRDKAILDDLQRFRCMTRDDIADIHFAHVKSKVSSTNTVLKRLRRDGYIDANLEKRPFLYFPGSSTMKRDSQKAPHFLAIVDFYKQLLSYEKPKLLEIEPKYGKAYMEPDAFMIWKSSPFFVEIQRSIFTERQIKEKIERYEAYHFSNDWKREIWQPREKKFFPYVWFVGDSNYNFGIKPFKIIQTKSVFEFMNRLTTVSKI